MDDLIAFLSARFDEDEQVARDAGAEAWRKAERPSIWVEREGGPVAQTKDFEDAAHIARHDPARVLREVEAKRRIADRETERARERWRRRVDEHRLTFEEWIAHWPPEMLRLLALPYVNHPDYREEWKP